MREEFNKMPVDAGMIGVVDADWAKARGGHVGDDCENEKIVLPPGKYKVTLAVRGTWNGYVRRSGIVNTSGVLVVGDPCYIWSAGFNDTARAWDALLDEVDYFRARPKRGVPGGWVVADTGGDGGFDASVDFERVGD